MKALVLVLTALSAFNVFASEIPCQAEAKQAAAAISAIGWGEAEGYLPELLSATQDGETSLYEFSVTIRNAKTNDRLGDSYKVTIDQDRKSEACIIQSLTVN